MNLLERVLTLLGANLNTMIEKADDPERVLRQLQLDMHNQLVQVKTQVATAIAEGHKLQKRSKEKTVEAKISEVETTIDLLVTRKRNALLQQRVFDALSKTGGPKEKERAARAQDAVLEAEARARALADLHNSDLTTQLEQLSEDQIIEQQMQDLKTKNKPLRDLPLLHEAKPHPSPLLRPKPRENTPAKKQAEGKLPGRKEPVIPASPTPQEEPDLT